MLDLEDLHSIIISYQTLIPRIVNEQQSLFLPFSAHLPRSMECNDRRSTEIISFKIIQYFRSLLLKIDKMHNLPMKWIVDLEDLITQAFNITSIP